MTLQHDYFSRASPETDWLAGLLAADGCVAQNLRRWSFSQSGEDGLELVETVARMIGYQASIHTGRTKGRDSHGISVTSPRMVSDLGSRYLIRPAKTLTYQWPKLEGEQARVIDGDGCVGTYPTPQGKQRVEDLLDTSPLPAKPSYGIVNDWLVSSYQRHWGWG